MKVWIFQRKAGKGNPWSVGWYEPNGRRREKQIGNKTQTKHFRRKIEAELVTTTYQQVIPKTWAEFRKEYENTILAKMKYSSATTYRGALDWFERIAKPKKMADINGRMIDQYVAKRLKRRGRKDGSTVSPVTVNSELKVFRSVFRIAKKWKYMADVPELENVQVFTRMKRYVTQEHFEMMYHHCDAARKPDHMPYDPEVWWQAFLVFTYMTGWRVSEPLALLRQDLDLNVGLAITRAEDNKGGRDEAVALHPSVVEHLERIAGFTPEVFPWVHSRRLLYDEFHCIQSAAGIHLTCNGDHIHTDTCHYYAFHDLRRGFATVTGKKLGNRALQQMMRHKSYATTQVYIDLRHQLDGVVDMLEAPNLSQGRKRNSSGA